MIAVTGATGQLGQFVIKHLLAGTPAENIVAVVRNPEKATALKEQGVNIRVADYTAPDALKTALEGVDKLLLISSSEVGQRLPQHKNVIDAAKQAGVKLIAYTSLLNVNDSPLGLAEEHIQTESYLQASGVPYVLLRNGWYTENYLASIPAALENSGFIGSAEEGKISSSAREDYGEAAAKVLLSSEPQQGKVYELAGDESYTLSELCAIISEESGRDIPYINLPQAEFSAALQKAGLPAPVAEMLADSDAGAANGALFDDSHVLRQLLGHPTTSLRQLVKNSL
ncbi:SDR family oxidoreductase [Alteromonas lipolytica]|uniref:NAD(P)-dependent oxidoreductase n=1 Tax=Alteromonas lipolytica TaxID=1856405 RepID=A0A1E8F9B5_9ALTE|nr:SDR family oxidoreductase [Alteromonas lipolytica]OFI32133.1 NAD(P)-dependent oxidoreductase [Alteromonas lipolytica]GGF83616.1 NAD(P)-dependent oxidoreductase [Alteromonas lipolytica]